MDIVDEFKELLLSKGSFQKEKLLKQFEEIDEDSIKVLERYLLFNKNNGCGLNDIADSYFFLVSETNKFQMQFFRNKQGGG